MKKPAIEVARELGLVSSEQKETAPLQKETRGAQNSPKRNYTTRLTALQRWAEAYKKVGFNILPCKANSKKPALDSWEEFQYRDLPLEDTLNSLDATMNLGVTQHNVAYAIIDFDDVDAMFGYLNGRVDFERKTLVANTTRGFHVLTAVTNYVTLNEKRRALRNALDDDSDAEHRLELKIIPLYKNGSKIGEVRIKGNTIVPPSKIDDVERNWYLLSITEAFEISKQDAFRSLKPISPDDFLFLVESHDLLELDLLVFEEEAVPKASALVRARQYSLESPAIESIEELEAQIINVVLPHINKGNRHDFCLAFASFGKYHFPMLGLTLEDSRSFTQRIIEKIVEAINDDEKADRLRAIEDSFSRSITAHKQTLTRILGAQGYEQLKQVIRSFRRKRNELEGLTQLEDVVQLVIQDLKAVTYTDNTYTLWFANGDAVEYEEKPLYKYVSQTYKFFPQISSKFAETKTRWELYKAIERAVAERRVKKLKVYHEGIHMISKDEFLVVLDDDNIFVYNTAFDNYFKGSRVHGSAIIEVKRELKDFDPVLLEKLLSLPREELWLCALHVLENLRAYFKHWNFEAPEAPDALASLMIILPVHTAWRWRPIVHFYGSAGSGKTTFFEFGFRTLYPTLCVQRSDTSKAGLLQQFSNTSYVALFDNLETSQLKKQDFFTVLEGASTIYEETKGTKDGAGISYTYRNLTVLNSVSDFIQREALDTRTVQFVLYKPVGKRPDALSTELAREFSTVSLAFSLRFWKEISTVYDDLAREGRGYQNIAYLYAVDKILTNAPLEKYVPFINQRRVLDEEIQLFRQILYTPANIAGEQLLPIDVFRDLVKFKSNVLSDDDKATKKWLEATVREFRKRGISFFYSRSDDCWKIAFEYTRLANFKIVDTEKYTQNTFETMALRLQASISKDPKNIGKKTTYFGKEQREWAFSFPFSELLWHLGIPEDDQP